MFELLGLGMLATWGYSVYVIVKRLGETTTVEKVILSASLIFFALFVIGALMAKEEPAIPTKYECLQLGSDMARRICINQYYQ